MVHRYDKCCSCKATPGNPSSGGKPRHDRATPLKRHRSSSEGGGDHAENYENTGNRRVWRRFAPAAMSFLMLAAGLLSDNILSVGFFTGYLRLAWYMAAYLPVGLPVLRQSFLSLFNRDVFNEFTLMSIATLGAFLIGEYPEGVAVMLFYFIGELFQESAVRNARAGIKALLAMQPRRAVVVRDNQYVTVKPEEVGVGETIRVVAGEKVPLDGVMLSAGSSFNTAALTGESMPVTIRRQETVLAGMINMDVVVDVQVTRGYADSSLSRILEMVQEASSRKARTELLIRRMARIYTPVVFFIAVAIALIPWFIVPVYEFTTWVYRALIFLVIACPCALVISIPLGYFGGIGAASRHGILFKGANYMDAMKKVNTVVFDKTGTLTEGVFEVKDIFPNGYEAGELTGIAAALESHSNHPVAKAIVSYAGHAAAEHKVDEAREIPGYGMEGFVDGKKVFVGNERLMRLKGIFTAPVSDIQANKDTAANYDVEGAFYNDAGINTNTDCDVPESGVAGHNPDSDTIVFVAVDGAYAGLVTIADRVKDDAADAIRSLRKLGIRDIVILSGDRTPVTRAVARSLGVDAAYGDLLPGDKLRYMEKLKEDKTRVTAFAGDGINDAPSLALSDVGIAMGALGSEAAVEVADVVIQTDRPSRIAMAIRISRTTHGIVIQNIVMALSVKFLVLLFGALGMAAMWEAVFADVGVALLAVLNAMRIQRKDFR